MEKPKTIKTLRNLIDSPLEIGIEEIPYNRDFFKVKAHQAWDTRGCTHIQLQTPYDTIRSNCTMYIRIPSFLCAIHIHPITCHAHATTCILGSHWSAITFHNLRKKERKRLRWSSKRKWLKCNNNPHNEERERTYSLYACIPRFASSALLMFHINITHSYSHLHIAHTHIRSTASWQFEMRLLWA